MEATQRLRCPTCACWPHTAAKRLNPHNGQDTSDTGPAPALPAAILTSPTSASVVQRVHQRRRAGGQRGAGHPPRGPAAHHLQRRSLRPGAVQRRACPFALLTCSGLAAAAGTCVFDCMRLIPACLCCLGCLAMSAGHAYLLPAVLPCMHLWGHACLLAKMLHHSLQQPAARHCPAAPAPPTACPALPPTAADVAHTAAVPRLPRAAPHPEARRRARVHGALLAGEAVHCLACVLCCGMARHAQSSGPLCTCTCELVRRSGPRKRDSGQGGSMLLSP